MEGAKKTIETGEMGQKRRFAPEAHCRKFYRKEKHNY